MNLFKQHHFLLWTVVAVLVIAIAFAAVFGTIAAVRAAGAVMRYEGLTISEGVYAYFTSYCKTTYIRSLIASGISAVDTPQFFARDRGDGVSYGEAFAAYTEAYVRTVAVSAWLFDSITSLTKSEKTTIKAGLNELVDFRAGGDRDRFNELTAKYGFTYNDLYDATVLQYKAEQLFVALYGEGTALMEHDTEACQAYYNEQYVYVKMLFIRTEDKLAVDEHGKPIYDETGEQKRIPLTDLEKRRRAEDIATLDAAIENLATGGSPVITEQMLTGYTSTYVGDKTYDITGWYFAPDAAATADLTAVYPTLTEAALRVELGSYTKVAYDDGVCYMLRLALPSDGYKNDEVAAFFSDFYVDCASVLHRDMLAERTDDVTLTDRYQAFDHVAIPYNYEYIVRLS